MTYSLRGRTIAITGAAGGLGIALATALRERDVNLVLLDRDGDAVDEIVNRFGPKSARGWTVDVRNLESLQTAMDQAAEHFGQIDVAVAGAGVGNLWGTMQSTPAAGWETVIDINLNGIWRTFKAAESHVAAQRGQLVAIASMASFVHSPLHGSYAASKAGVWALCDSLRVELREAGVNVACIHPTFFKTPMISDALDDPVTRAVWNDFTGPFKPAPIDQVVRGIISGIESRRTQVVIPKTFLPNAFAPGILRPLVDRFAFRRANIRRAIAHVDNP